VIWVRLLHVVVVLLMKLMADAAVADAVVVGYHPNKRSVG
jgi:hypothetical protein